MQVRWNFQALATHFFTGNLSIAKLIAPHHGGFDQFRSNSFGRQTDWLRVARLSKRNAQLWLKINLSCALFSSSLRCCCGVCCARNPYFMRVFGV
jgi:hypothetical protein